MLNAALTLPVEASAGKRGRRSRRALAAVKFSVTCNSSSNKLRRAVANRVCQRHMFSKLDWYPREDLPEPQVSIHPIGVWVSLLIFRPLGSTPSTSPPIFLATTLACARRGPPNSISYAFVRKTNHGSELYVVLPLQCVWCG